MGDASGLGAYWKANNFKEYFKSVEADSENCPSMHLLERNKACFEGQRNHISRIKNECLHNLYFGVKVVP